MATAKASLGLVKPRADARVAPDLAWPAQDLADRSRIDASLIDIRSEPRHALVVGNGGYADGIGWLANPTNDAEDMAAILEKVGFKVTRAVDLDRASMGQAIAEFGRALRHGGVGLFFYAGHAVQLNGKNFLIPIGTAVDEDNLPLNAIDVDHVFWHMGLAENRLNIVVLDSCRDNPFPPGFRRIVPGLAPMAARNTFVAYATAPGDVASDGFGERNSPFTEALLATIDDPGLKLEEVFKRVAAKVSERTRGDQTPWVQSSFTGDFYFHPPASVVGPQEVAGEPALPDRPDYLAWKAIEGSREPVDFETFIEAFPDSPLVPFAQSLSEKRLSGNSML